MPGSPFEVPAETELQRGPPVAEDVAGGADPWRDVAVGVDTLRFREHDRIRQKSGRSDPLFREPAARLVVSEATLQREAAQRELLLRIEGQNGRTGELRERIGFRELVRHAVIDAVPELLVVRVARAIVVEVGARVAELEAVRAR